MIRTALMLWAAVLALLPAADGGWPPSHARQLAPLAGFVGAWQGTGTSQLGPYTETLSGEWALNRTAIIVRTQSTAGGQTVFEDLRVFSYDPARDRLRLRQWAFGDLIEYDVVVADDGRRLVASPTAQEGGVRAPWRYTWTLSEDGGIHYLVETQEGGAWSSYVTGTLRR